MKFSLFAVVTLLQASSSSATVYTVPQGSSASVSCTSGGQCCSENASWGDVTLSGGGVMSIGASGGCNGVAASNTKLQNCGTSAGCGLDCSDDCTVLIDGQGAPSSTSTQTAVIDTAASEAPATTTGATAPVTAAAVNSSATAYTVPLGSSASVSCTSGGQCCSENASWGDVTLSGGGVMSIGASGGCNGVAASNTKLQNCGTSAGCGLDCSDDCTVLIDGQGAPSSNEDEDPSSGYIAAVTVPVTGIAVAMVNYFM